MKKKKTFSHLFTNRDFGLPTEICYFFSWNRYLCVGRRSPNIVQMFTIKSQKMCKIGKLEKVMLCMGCNEDTFDHTVHMNFLANFRSTWIETSKTSIKISIFRRKPNSYMWKFYCHLVYFVYSRSFFCLMSINLIFFSLDMKFRPMRIFRYKLRNSHHFCHHSFLYTFSHNWTVGGFHLRTYGDGIYTLFFLFCFRMYYYQH